MIAPLPTTGPDQPLGWIVAGASAVSCRRCGRAAWLDPGSYVLWPLELRQFIHDHVHCVEAGPSLEDLNRMVVQLQGRRTCESK